MKNRMLLPVLLVALVVTITAFTIEDFRGLKAETEVKELILESYVHGAFNELNPKAMLAGFPTEERLNSIRRHIPSNRLGEPEELAQAILFLASEEASYINGIVLPVDSALSAREAGPVIK